ADAIRDALTAQVKGITEFASLATRRRRERARKHFDGALAPSSSYRGAYEKRYSGGRTGMKAPGQTDRLFNDSERFAEGVFVRQNQTDNTFTVNVPTSRLDPSTFTGAAFQAMLAKLRELVPGLADVRHLLED